MVNEESLALLHLLKATDGPVSGVALAQGLGISRVALWKRVEALRAAGYPIAADRRGYRLGPSDKPLPWEFPGDEGRTVHFETLGSTMDEALRLGLAGARGTAVIAETQTAGRGRADRGWQSPGGNLLVSLVLAPRLPMAYAGALGLEALCALADTLEDLYGLGLDLHWPNDLTKDGAKVAGVLVEAWGPVDGPRFWTLGLGLNVQTTPHLDRRVACLADLGVTGADRRAVLALWRRRLEAWCADPTLDPRRWQARCPLPGHLVAETFDGRQRRGRPLGFDRTGALRLQGPSTTSSIRYGETRRTQGVAT